MSSRNQWYVLLTTVAIFSFGWRRIRPVVPSERCKNELTLPLLHLCCKEINHLCGWRVCTKRAWSPVKSLQVIWNEQFSLHFELLFAVTCFKWLTEDLLKNDSPSKVRLLNSAGPNTALPAMHSQKWQSKKSFLLSRACADKSLPCY